MFYGPHGSGKTLLAGTAADAPGMGDVIVIDAEGGKDTLHDSDRIEHKDRITVVRVQDYESVAHVHDWLKAHCKARDANDELLLKKLESVHTGVPVAEIEQPRKYRTVVLDSLSEIEGYSTYKVLGIDTDDLFQDDMPVSGWPEFRKNLESVKLMCRAFRDLPMHKIFTASESYKQDQTKRMNYQPFLTGQLATSVIGMMSMVGYLVVDAPKMGKNSVMEDAPRRLFVQPVTGMGPFFKAKNRYSKFKGAFFDDPNMTEIMEAIGLSSPSS